VTYTSAGTASAAEWDKQGMHTSFRTETSWKTSAWNTKKEMGQYIKIGFKTRGREVWIGLVGFGISDG